MKRWSALLGPVVSLLACSQPQIPAEGPAETLPAFSRASYEQEPADQIYCVDGERSQAEILVRRGGALARFGHDHVVVARDLHGIILKSPAGPSKSRADLRVDLRTLIVDEPGLREKYALDTQPTPSDIARTSGNLQSKVLNTSTWKEALLHMDVESESATELEAGLTIQLRGRVVELPLSVRLHELGQGRFLAEGEFSVLQSDFGMEPFSVLGGGLQVEDRVDLFFHVEAQKPDPGQRCSMGT